MPSSRDWLHNFLIFLGHRYAYVLLDITETYLLSKVEKEIAIEYYCEDNSIKDISLAHSLTKGETQDHIDHILDVILGVKLQ